jgi:mannose-6-phosphate isomerase-like protein (cupin superfamily)
MRRPGAGQSFTGMDYDEVIVVQEGRATCIEGDQQREVKAGDIIVIPAGTPHTFVNSGDTPLRQIDIHASPKFITKWLDTD